MIWNRHLNLKGSHAIFGASKHSWLRYDDQKMIESIRSKYRKDLGTEIHEFASSQIQLRHRFTNIKNLKTNLESYIFRKFLNDETNEISDFGKKMINNLQYLPKESLETIKSYINDGIGFRMTTEQPLYFSDYFFGTADTICYRDKFLRIHDLKSGSTVAHIEQLLIYAALFCIEYKIQPEEIETELRIYQNGEVLCNNPDPDEVRLIMDKIIFSDNMLQKLEKEE